MSISDDINMIINESPAPPNMPPNIREARDTAHWASILFLVMAGLIAIAGILNVISETIWIVYGGIVSIIFGAIYLALAFLAFHAATQVKKKVIPMLDMGNIKGAKEESVKWLIVGLFAGFIPFILMILTYIKLDENAQPYPAGPYPQQPQQNYQQPPPPGYAAPPGGQPMQNTQYAAQQAPPAQQNYQQPPPQQQGYQPPAQSPPPQNYPPQGAPPQPQVHRQPYQQAPPAPQNQYQATTPPAQPPPSQNYQPPQAQSPPPSGIPMQVTRCPNCGAEVKSGMEACPNCGAKLV